MVKVSWSKFCKTVRTCACICPGRRFCRWHDVCYHTLRFAFCRPSANFPTGACPSSFATSADTSISLYKRIYKRAYIYHCLGHLIALRCPILCAFENTPESISRLYCLVLKRLGMQFTRTAHGLTGGRNDLIGLHIYYLMTSASEKHLLYCDVLRRAEPYIFTLPTTSRRG